MASLLCLFEILKSVFWTLYCTFPFAINTSTVVDLRRNQALNVVIRSVRGARAQLLQQLLTVKEVVLIEHLVQIALNIASQGLG